ncbi:MAG TPA: TonB family protein [Terriglobales bacterium]|nr:TonB family protein [Terriglobales bacterium]
MSQVFENHLFSLLPEKRAPWKEFVCSMGFEAGALVLLAWVGVLHPEVLVPPAHNYQTIALVTTPAPVNHQPAPMRVVKPAPVPQVEVVPETALRLPPEIHRKPVANDPPSAPKLELADNKIPQIQPKAPAIPRELVKTNVFSTGSSATPTMAAAPEKVQTGGFGDPNGVPAKDGHGKPVNIASLGSFDLPSGPGYGNGTGGAKGVRGVVSSAGFGNGTATGDGSGRSNVTRGNVQSGSFGTVEATTASQLAVKHEVTAEATPAEIISKPTPVYTEEARKLRVEGEVLLQVVFEANGQIRVLRVVQGLGHGLDEAAIRAAEQIHFKPAQRDGRPTDSTAVLHIVFQLA